MPELGVYVLTDQGDPQPVAECDDDSLGFCLRTLHDEQQITSGHTVGILDLVSRQWLANPWPATPFGSRT